MRVVAGGRAPRRLLDGERMGVQTRHQGSRQRRMRVDGSTQGIATRSVAVDSAPTPPQRTPPPT